MNIRFLRFLLGGARGAGAVIDPVLNQLTYNGQLLYYNGVPLTFTP